MGEYLAPQRPHPPSALLGRLVERGFDSVLDTFEIVRVGQVSLPEFGCGTGEFAQDQAPPRSLRQATYSLATRFMPSRRGGVTSMTSDATKKAINSSRGTGR